MAAAAGNTLDEWITMPGNKVLDKAYELEKEGKVDSAMLCYNIVVNRFDNNADRKARQWYVKALTSMGSLYFQRYHNNTLARNYLNKAMVLSKKYGMTDNYSNSCLLLGIICHSEYIAKGDKHLVDSAARFIRNAYHAAKSARDWEGVVLAVYNLTTMTYNENNPKDIAVIRDFLAAPVPSATKNLAYTRTFCKGALMIKEKKFDEALRYFKQLPQTITRKNITMSMSALANLADVYKRMGNYRMAIAETGRLCVIAQAHDNQGALTQAYQDLSDLYALIGDMAKSRDYADKSESLRNQLQTREMMDKIAVMPFESQVDSLSFRIHEMMSAQRRQHIALAAILLVAIALGTLSFFLARTLSRLRKSQKVLYRQNQRMIAQNEELDSNKPAQNDADGAKYQSNQLETDRVNEIYHKVRHAMANSDMICRSDFTLKLLAESIGERQRDVSQVINMRTGNNLHALLNEYRIAQACRIINGLKPDENPTIDNIAYQVGIKSRSAFTTTFKKITGLTPSEYIRISRENGSVTR